MVIEGKEIDSLPITIDPEVLSGTPVFRGTRVPVNALLSNIEAGLTVNEFLENSYRHSGTGASGSGVFPVYVTTFGSVQMKIRLDECTPRLLKRLSFLG